MRMCLCILLCSTLHKIHGVASSCRNLQALPVLQKTCYNVQFCGGHTLLKNQESKTFTSCCWILQKLKFKLIFPEHFSLSTSQLTEICGVFFPTVHVIQLQAVLLSYSRSSSLFKVKAISWYFEQKSTVLQHFFPNTQRSQLTITQLASLWTVVTCWLS